MVLKELLEYLTRSQIGYRTDYPLAGLSSFRIGGPADCVVMPRSTGQLADAVRAAHDAGLPVLIVGRGSNILFPDEGYRGCVVLTDRCDRFSFDGTLLHADAGAALPRLSCACRDRGLAGLEFACGIPGTLGGALIMNAGAYGSQIDAVTACAHVCDVKSNEFFDISTPEMNFSYRHSAFADHPEWVILGVDLLLTPGDIETIAGTMRINMESRRAKQPLDLPSAGSAFKRPEGHFAAKLIDDCGLRGFSVGGAQVSEKHTGFIVNRGGATAADVRELIRQIRERVLAETGVLLEPEIRIIGEATT